MEQQYQYIRFTCSAFWHVDCSIWRFSIVSELHGIFFSWSVDLFYFIFLKYLSNTQDNNNNIITILKIYGTKEINTAYKLIDNYILSIKIKLNLNQMKYLKHLPFLFKLADLICLKGYVFFCFIFDFQNVLEMIKDGNNSFTPTGPQIRFS